MNAANNQQKQHILDVARPLILGKSFNAVGLTELLAAAQVPKGSFYHYFASKEAFGEALLNAYFDEQLEFVDDLLSRPGTAVERLMKYWQYWLDSQGRDDPASRCLAVKLSAEVCGLSESMRIALDKGIRKIIERLANCIQEGATDGSLPAKQVPEVLATMLYQTWMGASLLAMVTRNREPLEAAMTSTRQLLYPSNS